MSLVPEDSAGLASHWVSESRKAEALREELTTLQHRHDKALEEVNSCESVAELLVEIRGNIRDAQVASYLGKQPQSDPRIAEWEKLATIKETQLTTAQKRGAIAQAAADALATEIADLRKRYDLATNRTILAQHAWAKFEGNKLISKVDANFDQVCGSIVEMVALQNYLPPVKHLYHLNVTQGDIAQEIFSQLKKITEKYPKPSRPFTYKWLRHLYASSLPGVEAARDRLDTKVRGILSDGHEA